MLNSREPIQKPELSLPTPPEAIKILGEAARQANCGLGSAAPKMRATSMAERGTGTMSVLTLGFATGAVGAARGGREMNNALVDAKEKAEPLEEAIGRANLSAEHFGLLVALDLVRPNYI